MISAARLVYEFDLRYNRFQGTHDQRVRLEDKLSVINQAVRVVYSDLVRKAEVSTWYRNALRPLEVKEQELSVLRRTADYDVYEIPQGLYKLLRVGVTASKESCGDKFIPVVFFQTDDLNQSMASNFWKPSYAWELCVGDEGRDGYYLWHGGDYDISRAVCDYYLAPSEVHAPSLSGGGEYVDWNGERRVKDVGLELDADFIFDRIIDVAVLTARYIKGDVSDYELTLSKILQTEKINN